MLRRLSFFAAASLALTIAYASGCSSSGGGDGNDAGGADGTTPGQDGSTPGQDGSTPGQDGSTPGQDGGGDGGATDGGGDAGTDATLDTDAGFDAGPPAVRFMGRVDRRDVNGERLGWPGTRVLARFDGTSASVRLTQTNGGEGGPSWFNVVVDGATQTPFMVTGVSQDYVVAQGLAAGTHTIEIEKRTEANLGVVRFEGFTFQGGAGLLPPPPPSARRLEVLGESTIDGFGVEGDVNATCGGDAPPQYHNARKGMAGKLADSLGADLMLTAYSGKGVFRNPFRADGEVFGDLYPRTLPDDATGLWSFASYVPHVVVISLGGADYVQVGGDAQPTDGQIFAKYDALVGKIRQEYPQAYIFCTVWSQIKDDGAPVGYTPRTSLTRVLNGANGVVTQRKAAGDNRLYFHLFQQAVYPTDETGCYYHANEAHHTAKAAELATAIKAATGW